jgi:hypothetical protein
MFQRIHRNSVNSQGIAPAGGAWILAGRVNPVVIAASVPRGLKPESLLALTRR